MWKTFLISFVLNIGKYKNINLWDSTKINYLHNGQCNNYDDVYKQRFKSTSLFDYKSKSITDKLVNNDLNNVTDILNSEMLTRNNNSFFSKLGYDNRYNNTENKNDLDIIFNITLFHQQLHLLKKLKKTNISQHTKLDLIEKYNKNKEKSNMVSNISEGGLYKDWNYDIDL
jgi:hypothetical protein